MKLNWWTALVLLSLLQTQVSCQDMLILDNLFTRARDILFSFVGKSSVGRGLTRAVELKRIQPPIMLPFPCDMTHARSEKRPQSVHELRPGDIDVIGAMGDSLTAGNGAAASRLIDVTIENRGLSWAIGGQGTWREYMTLPNILKEFNPKLIGYSLADSLSHHKESQFNVAEIGSMSQDMRYMAEVLVKRIKADSRVNFKKDWKLITLMIGANDFCLDFCFLSSDRFRNSAENHRRDLIETLDYLRDNMPRTLVNLVLVPNLSILHDLKGFSKLCEQLHLISCPCLFGKRSEYQYGANIAMQYEWQRVQREVARDDRYRHKEDFAVVLQPFTAHLIFPVLRTPKGDVVDSSFLSQDCFHFSQKAYARAANALWNNMMEPLGNKTENWSETFSRFLCPTKERPFIFTHGNSNP